MKAVEDLKWLIIILIGLWFLWYFAGGKLHPQATSGPFINPPAPLDDGKTYGAKI